MMHRALLVAAAAIAAAGAVATAAIASSQFVVLTYHPRTETTIVCARMLECDVALEQGERVRNGFAAVPDDWDPHAAYSGLHGAETPHLVFRPARAGLSTNAIIPTSHRTYYLRLVSDNSRKAHYYGFTFPRVFIARTPATPAPASSPLPQLQQRALPENPMQACLPYRYTFDYDRGLPADHAHNARTNYADFPPAWIPAAACTDGRHTFVQFPPTDVTPGDTPIVATLTEDGDTSPNYTYDAGARRFRIDAVPEAFVIELGSQTSPLRIIVRRLPFAGLK